MQWPECALTKGQADHYQYVRRRIPNLSKKPLLLSQNEICVICGNVRTQGTPDSKEHLVPVMWFVRTKWKLTTKNRRANSSLNIGVSHKRCNQSRNNTPLLEYWKRHPEFEQPAKLAFAGLLAKFQNIPMEDYPLVYRILEEFGMRVQDDK